MIINTWDDGTMFTKIDQSAPSLGKATLGITTTGIFLSLPLEDHWTHRLLLHRIQTRKREQYRV